MLHCNEMFPARSLRWPTPFLRPNA